MDSWRAHFHYHYHIYERERYRESARARERERLNTFIIITSLSDLRESESERARERRGIGSIQRELELDEFERSLNASYTSTLAHPLNTTSGCTCNAIEKNECSALMSGAISTTSSAQWGLMWEAPAVQFSQYHELFEEPHHCKAAGNSRRLKPQAFGTLPSQKPVHLGR